nr:TolC family protein [Escherichia coli]
MEPLMAEEKQQSRQASLTLQVMNGNELESGRAAKCLFSENGGDIGHTPECHWQVQDRAGSIAARACTVIRHDGAYCLRCLTPGVQPEAIAAPPAELAEQPVSLKNIDYQSIPLVLAAENLRQSAQYGVEKTKAQYWPTLSIQGGKTRYQTSDRSYWDDQLQLNVNAPLYQGGAVSAQVQQAEGQQKISASQVEQAKLDVLQRASVAYANWTGARGREEAGLAQSESAHKTRDVYQNEYKLGKRSLNDLLTVEQDVFQAQSAEINANYDGWVAAVNYAAAVNNLIPLAGIKQGLYNDLPDLK